MPALQLSNSSSQNVAEILGNAPCLPVFLAQLATFPSTRASSRNSLALSVGLGQHSVLYN